MSELRMFTGIVETLGKILSLERESHVTRLTVEAPAISYSLNLGDSVAIDGICTTVVSHDASCFAVQLQQETMKVCACSRYRYGQTVNLERALLPSSRMGGHMVQGHVDVCVPVRSFHREGEDMVLRFQLPPEYSGLVVKRGFIAISGISLTVTEVTPEYAVHIIPATLENTILKSIGPGDLINIETDIIGKYVKANLVNRQY